MDLATACGRMVLARASRRWWIRGWPGGIITSQQPVEQLLADTDGAVPPGFDSGRPPSGLVPRLAHVELDGGTALAAEHGVDSVSDEDFLRAWCTRTVEAVQRICRWLLGLGG
jgi:aspartate aminotransferase